jgi:hypothetical protein
VIAEDREDKKPSNLHSSIYALIGTKDKKIWFLQK